MREDGIEILAALADDGGEADDLRPRAHDDEQLQLAVVLKVDIGVIKFHGVHANTLFLSSVWKTVAGETRSLRKRRRELTKP